MKAEEDVESARAEMAAIRRGIAEVGLLSGGYVQDRGRGAGGPCYQWTRKVRGKTVSVALSREQYEAMREAIGNWRVLKAWLSRLEELSRTVIFGTLPDTRRSKPPSRATLGLGKRPKSP